MKIVPKSKEPSVYQVMTWLERRERKPFKAESEEDHWNKTLVRQVRRQSDKRLGFELEVSHAVKAMIQGKWLMAHMYCSAAPNQIDHMEEPEKWLLYALLEIEAKLAQGQTELAVNGSIMCVHNLSKWVGWDHPCTRSALLRASWFEKRSDLITALLKNAAENGVK